MAETLTSGSYPIHDFDPIIFEITDGFGPRYYGLAYVLGFVIAFWLLHRASKTGRSPLEVKQVEPFVLYIVAGVMIGGRLGSMLLYNLGDFLSAPWIFFKVWEGGMASHGGFIGVCLAVLVYAWRHKIAALRLGDLVAMAAPPGIFLGRIANYINGELWGRPSTVPWARIFPGAPYDGSAPGYFEPALTAWVNPRHPSQLYEAGLEGLLLGAWVLWRFWSCRGMLRRPGQLVAEFLVGYSVVRIIGEQFRERDKEHIEGIFDLSRGVFYSLITLAIGIGLWIWLRWRERRAGA